jgi:hypothetical protein
MNQPNTVPQIRNDLEAAQSLAYIRYEFYRVLKYYEQHVGKDDPLLVDIISTYKTVSNISDWWGVHKAKLIAREEQIINQPTAKLIPTNAPQKPRATAPVSNSLLKERKSSPAPEIIKSINTQKAEIPSSAKRSLTPVYSESDANLFLRHVREHADERDATRWISMMEKKGHRIIVIATTNGEVWTETNSVYGDTLFAVRLPKAVFVIPSPTDTRLRSASIPAWFDVNGTGTKYRIDKLAIGTVETNNSFFPSKRGLISL